MRLMQVAAPIGVSGRSWYMIKVPMMLPNHRQLPLLGLLVASKTHQLGARPLLSQVYRK
jgi:hypothetical protein